MMGSRIIIMVGTVTGLLLAGGCSSPVKPAPSSTAGAPVEGSREVGAGQVRGSGPGGSVLEADIDADIDIDTDPAAPLNTATDTNTATTPLDTDPAPNTAPAPPLHPAPTPVTLATTTEAPRAVADMLQRLRDNFGLGNLEAEPRRLRHFEEWYSRRPRYFEQLVERAYWLLPYVLGEVEKRGMPGEVALLPAIESAFRPDAVSRSGAVGLWQFIPATGRHYGLRQDWWMDGRRDLVLSTRAALDYLDFLAKEFDGDWELAFAAYNAGEGTVRQQVRRNLKRNQAADYSSLALRRETADYVPRLFAVRNIIAQPHKFGITLNAIPNRPTVAVIDARSQTDLSVAATLGGLDAARFRYFNQGYKRGVTPPGGPHTLVVPVEFSAKMRTALDRLGVEQRLRWARHRVREGEYLGRIARQYDVSVASIVAANQLESSLIHPHQELRIPLSAGRYQYAASTPDDVGDDAQDSVADEVQVHEVRRGDSLWGISRRYGVSIANLTHWNQITKGALLHPGQSLVVRR